MEEVLVNKNKPYVQFSLTKFKAPSKTEHMFIMEKITMEMKMSVEEAKNLSKELMQKGYH